MIIVVEGPDGAGKSTLIRNLRENTKRYFVSIHNSGPPGDLEEALCIIDFLRFYKGSVPIVCDRLSLISDRIYGPVLRGASVYDEIPSVTISHLLRMADRVIYCRPPTSVILQKMHDNPQLKGVTKNIEEITRRYDSSMRALAHQGTKVFEYNWTQPDIDYGLEQLFFGDIE